jgi:hypothetical protein
VGFRVVLLAVALVQPWAAAAGAQNDPGIGGPVTSGPTVTLDRYSLHPGEPVIVTLEGFEASAVTISVCGNRAARGSVDCNMPASEGLGLDRDGSPTVGQMPVAAPEVPCPCIIRVSTTNQDEIAVAPIELIGHPVGPIVESGTEAPLEVSVVPRRAPHGVMARLRAAIGGPTAYDVTVSVRNRSTEDLGGVTLTGAAGRTPDEDVTSFELPPIELLRPGQTWEHTVRATIPAPVVGGFVWQVTASGAGASISAEESSRALPLGLLLLVLVLVVDLGAIVWRRVARRHRQRDAGAAVALT